MKTIDLNVPEGRDERFKKALDLVGYLMNLNECNMTWDQFRDHEFVVDSLKVVDETRKMNSTK